MPKYPRIIVNSRYCRVARSGEQTDGKNIVSGFAMENLVPVSYTHLDVYKRQLLSR